MWNSTEFHLAMKLLNHPLLRSIFRLTKATLRQVKTLKALPASSATVDVVPYPVEPFCLAQLPSVSAPHPSRSRRELVEALLDEAHAQGHKTYPQLISYVATQSGTPCSRRTVSNWKRSRKLLNECA